MQRNYIELFLCGVLFLLGFSIFSLSMMSSWLLPGIDGLYYAIQVSWLMNYGYLKYIDPPITFYLLTLTTYLTGDLFFGIKIGVSLFTALAVIPIYLFFRRIGRSIISGFVASLIFIVNPYIYRLIGDFMKNAVALGFLALGLYFLVDTDYGDLKHFFTVLAILILTGLTHILVFGVFILYILLLTFASLFTRNICRSAMYALLIPAIFSVFIMYPLLTGGDIWKAFSILYQILSSGTIRLAPKIDWFILSYGVVLASIIIGYEYYRRGDTLLASFFIINGLSCLLLNFPYIPSSILFRTQLMTVVPLVYTVGGLAVGVSNDLRASTSLLIIIILILSLSIPSIYGVRPSIPKEEYVELKSFIDSVYSGVIYLVPDVRLKYWVETLTNDVAKKLDPSLFSNYSIVFLIIDIRSRHIPKDMRPVYEGRFIKVFEFKRFSAS